MIDEGILREYFKRRKKAFFSVGIESGNDRVLKEIANRRTSRKIIRNKLGIIKSILEEDGFVNGSFIIGFPDETKDEIYETIEFAQESDIDWAAFFCYMPLPGTPLFETCVKKGYICPDRTDFSMIKPGNSILNMPHLSAKEITHLWNYANYRVNFVHNKMIQNNPKKAIKAFDYVLTVVPEHCFAFYGLYKCYKELGNSFMVDKYLSKFKSCSKEMFWRGYVEELVVEDYILSN